MLWIAGLIPSVITMITNSIILMLHAIKLQPHHAKAARMAQNAR